MFDYLGTLNRDKAITNVKCLQKTPLHRRIKNLCLLEWSTTGKISYWNVDTHFCHLVDLLNPLLPCLYISPKEKAGVRWILLDIDSWFKLARNR